MQPVEIERRFRIIDSSGLPPLGSGFRMIQCYLPKWRVELVDNEVVFEGLELVRDLTRDAVIGIRALIDGGSLTPRIRIKDDLAFFTINSICSGANLFANSIISF